MTSEAASQAQRMRQLRAAIAARLERGDSVDNVERELIDPAGLPDEHHAAVWLYAWSLATRTFPSQPRLRLLRSTRSGYWRLPTAR